MREQEDYQYELWEETKTPDKLGSIMGVAVGIAFVFAMLGIIYFFA